jgi:hypothetical protein
MKKCKNALNFSFPLHSSVLMLLADPRRKCRNSKEQNVLNERFLDISAAKRSLFLTFYHAFPLLAFSVRKARTAKAAYRFARRFWYAEILRSWLKKLAALRVAHFVRTLLGRWG